jgi:hypothetical protein
MPARDGPPDEKVKMTVSERSVAALAPALFEHASMGRHDPTGFAGWSAVAGGPGLTPRPTS